MKAADRRICSGCGHELSGAVEFCPICMLGQALAGQTQADESSAATTSPQAPHRFEHYEVMYDGDGKPLELGRGAMGITYKALDVDLRCPVTLKVINEKFLGDESARLRFLREARAAASLRHANVASVLHLGRTKGSYFYAMEFVAGETLEKLIKRTGRFDVQLALQIVAQVAAGLAAMHKQDLVHRDIKPSNIMVSLEEGGAVTVKIIDLGLAKAINEAESQTTISVPGGFAGTPKYASPEQFAGVGVDIRSDLYSLGVMLWEMVTGHPLFAGSPIDMMSQRQRGQLSRHRLEGVPQPVIVLLERLLEKDPAERFQTPNELLEVIPAIIGALDSGRRATRRVFQKTTVTKVNRESRGSPARPEPKKISVARLPVTGSELFGREEDIAFLDASWANRDVNIVTIVAWAGVGKSTLVNHWLGRMAAEHYRSAHLVFGWSFYRQGSSGGTSSANEFIDAALSWFGDPDPRLGTDWEKGERLANLISHRRTLLVLDGLEPLQNPPGQQEGRLRDPSLQALLRELAAFNKGLCIVTTRLSVAEIADREQSTVLRHDLEHLSSDAGAQLVRALGVKGGEAELRRASDEFRGHCLALALLGSYLTDACNGDIRYSKEVSKRLVNDVRQGVHARKVMESYEHWFGEGPELSVLRMLGLFDRPADERALGVLLKSPAIPGLTDRLTDLRPGEWRTVVARLRRAKLLAEEDPQNPGHLDAHPLVREYFGEQLWTQHTDAWKQCNQRLYNHYRTLAPQMPESIKEMEPLFLAVICGCNAGMFREALHEVYIPRIQRGNAYFAANVLGARGALLSVLIHFFEDGGWSSPLKPGVEPQRLTAEDQLFILMQAGLYLSSTRGFSTPEPRICYERAEPLCHALNRPVLLYSSLMGQWRYSYMAADKLTAALSVAHRVHSLAVEQNNSAVMIGACQALVSTLYYLGEFEAARQYAKRGVQIWRSGGVQYNPEDLDAPAVVCLCYEALCQWHMGEIASCHPTMEEAISLAKELNEANSLAVALQFAAFLARYERDPDQVERLASDLIELSTRQNFAFWLAHGTISRGWARSALGNTAEGLALLDAGIRDFRATGAIVGLPCSLVLKAEALYLANRTSEALSALEEAQAVAQRTEDREYFVELHRLRGVFLAANGADEVKIEASFREAIRIAQEQKSISLEKCGESTLAEYRRQKARASGGFRLPLANCLQLPADPR
jgi:serine/threonine protein kinase/tetratricopeptide (TPR) repeat protein